jgi:hypothetical protein
MATFDDCVKVILAKGGDLITEAQAKELVNELHTFAKAKKGMMNLEDLDKEVLAMLGQRSKEHKLAILIEKRNRIINLRRRKEAIAFVDEFDDPALGIKALMGGTVKLYKKARLSIDAKGKALANKYLGRLVSDLDKEGLLYEFNSGRNDLDIARELWELRPDGDPGKTGNATAKKIAAVVHKYQTLAVDRQNNAGAWIKKLPGYIVRQSHDQIRIRRAGFEAWRDAILPLLDHEQTFGTADIDEFLRGAYLGLSSGMHLRFKGADESNYMFGFTGPANVAKKVSKQRMLHFKDADSWHAYNEQFGSSNLRESIIYGLEHSARNAALMEGLGTNPLAQLDTLLKHYKKKYRDNPEMFDRLSDTAIQDLFKEIDGTTRIPVNLSRARISAGIRMIQNMSKLGGATISAFTDIPFQVAEMRYQGISPFKAYGNALRSLFRGRGDKETKEIARLLGVGFDGMIGEIMSRFSSQDHLPGTMAKTQQRFFKLNLMTWWNDAHRTGVGLMMSNHMAELRESPHAMLPEETRRILSIYGIEGKEWDLLRTHAVTKQGDNFYMTSDALEEGLTDDVLASYLGYTDKLTNAQKRVIRETRDRLTNQLEAYFVDRADFAVPMPGAAERAFMNRGTVPGTVMGEVARFFWQFKSFPITVIHKALGREVYGSGAKSLRDALLRGHGDIMGIAHIIVATTMFGYLSMATKDVLKGREPREINAKTIWAAMAQGGGLGIYGDFLFGEFSRYGRSFLETLSGPTFGQFGDLGELWTRLRNGDDAAANFTRMVLNNTPFINLFYTRAALDYLILYQIQEMANPGYLRRMESRLQRENNQKFLVPPSRVVPRGGGKPNFEAFEEAVQ